MVHNAFRQGIDVFGKEAEQLCFDLHTWFKQAPCKDEDFRYLSEDIDIDSSLFLRHISARWLTLVPALDRVSERSEVAIKYFLTFLPYKKEYKYHLPKNEREQRISKSFKEDKRRIELQMAFLKNIAPICTKFLTMFQTDVPFPCAENLMHPKGSWYLKIENLLIKKTHTKHTWCHYSSL